MASKKRNVWDDIGKMVIKQLESQAKSRGGKKAGKEIAEKVKDAAKKGKGKGGTAGTPAKPKKPNPTKPSAEAKDVPKPKMTNVGPSNKAVVLPKKPTRPARTVGALLKDNAARRQAEIDARRMLKQADGPSMGRPDRSPNADVRRGAPPPVGRSKSQPKGPSRQYEADEMRRLVADDKRRMGAGVAGRNAQKARMQNELARLQAKAKSAKPDRKKFFHDKINQQRKLMGLAPEKFERSSAKPTKRPASRGK